MQIPVWEYDKKGKEHAQIESLPFTFVSPIAIAQYFLFFSLPPGGILVRGNWRSEGEGASGSAHEDPSFRHTLFYPFLYQTHTLEDELAMRGLRKFGRLAWSRFLQFRPLASRGGSFEAVQRDANTRRLRERKRIPSPCERDSNRHAHTASNGEFNGWTKLGNSTRFLKYILASCTNSLND